MRSNTSLLGRALLWIALQARHLNENLEKNLQIESVCSVCSVDVLVACGKKSFILTKEKRKIYGKIWMVSVLFVYLQLQK